MARGGGVIIEKICDYLEYEARMKQITCKIPAMPGTSRILPEEIQEHMLPPTIPVKSRKPLQIVPDDELELHF